jgi:hypothetical protein
MCVCECTCMCVSARVCVCVYVCTPITQVSSPCLFTGTSLKQLILFNLTKASINFVCGYIVEDVVTTFGISAALCHTEHPVRSHLT